MQNEHGPLDILINNAGVGMSARFLAMPLEDWDWIVSINLMGAIYMCQAFGPQMACPLDPHRTPGNPWRRPAPADRLDREGYYGPRAG